MKSVFHTILFFAVTLFTAFFVFAQEITSVSAEMQTPPSDLSKLEIPSEDDPVFNSSVTVSDREISSSFSDQLKQKTGEIYHGIVSGDINATEHAEKVDSFLSVTFMRIRDSWVLCKQEFALAQEAAVVKAKEAHEQMEKKFQNTIDTAKQQYVDGVLDGTSTAKTKIEDIIQNSIDTGTQTFNQISEKASSTQAQISDKVIEFKDSGIQHYESLKDSSVEKYESVRDSAKDAWLELKDSMVQQIDTIKENASSFLPSVSSSQSGNSAVQP